MSVSERRDVKSVVESDCFIRLVTEQMTHLQFKTILSILFFFDFLKILFYF